MEPVALVETSRLRLRPFVVEDIDWFAGICADPEVMKYISGGRQDNSIVQQRINHWIKSFNDKGYSLLAIHHKNDRKMIGFCGLIDQCINNKRYIELGYRLDKKYWNMGIASEAALAIKEYAAKKLEINELISIIQPLNLASIRVAEKIGMKPLFETTINTDKVIIYHCLNNN